MKTDKTRKTTEETKMSISALLFAIICSESILIGGLYDSNKNGFSYQKI